MAAVITDVQPGDFRCVPVGGAGGALIGLGEQLNGDAFSQYRHAEVYVGALLHEQLPDEPAPFGWVARAQPGGAVLRPLEAAPSVTSTSSLWSTGAITLDAAQRAAVVQAALECLGTPYSWLDYFALAAHRLDIPAPGLKSFIASSGHMICSQQVDHCYLAANVHLFSDGRWEGYVTPADLAALIEQRRAQWKNA